MKIFVFTFVLLIFSGCSSLGNSVSSSDVNDCVIVSNPPQPNSAGSADTLLVKCLDKKRSKRESERGFWHSTLEEFAFSVFDIIFSS